MRLAIVGGKLQGTEAAYLAGEAGYDVVLVDRRADRPASGLAAETHVFDVTADPVRTRELLLGCDAVLPACEDEATLEFLSSFAPGLGVPLLFDFNAYLVTQSKVASNELFARLDVPRPRPWPACGLPAVVKPSVGSGSTGVRLVVSEPGLVLARAALAAQGEQAVVEEYVAGPSLSIEVIALGGEALTLLPTFLEFDAVCDCKRVVAPVEPVAPVSAATMAALDHVARRLADGVSLGGVMDVEVMVAADGTPKVIEIDARLPSQTPAAVFHASGANIVELLVESFAAGRPAGRAHAGTARRRLRARPGRQRPRRGARRAHRGRRRPAAPLRRAVRRRRRAHRPSRLGRRAGPLGRRAHDVRRDRGGGPRAGRRRGRAPRLRARPRVRDRV